MINKTIYDYHGKVVQYRRHFHQFPEVSWQELKTSAYIKSELEKNNIPYKSIAKTGIEVMIKGDVPGKTVALRADIDALNVNEATSHGYKSRNEGVMHACGHDGHTAMLLCAALILNEYKSEIKGSVKLLFQPAEEMVEGAKRMIQEGALENVDAIFGIHLWTEIETGKISLESGPRMASGDYLLVDIKGKGGHGSLPHQTVDASLIAASFISNIQSLVSREIDPLESVVISFGKIESGSRFNIISGHAHLEGTARCFSPQIRKVLADLICQHGDHICQAYNASFELEFREGTPPTINDSTIAELGERVVESCFGKNALVSYNKTTGSEDMAYYLEKISGAIAFVGARNDGIECNYPHHHPKFNIDEDSLLIGLELYIKFALSYLSKS